MKHLVLLAATFAAMGLSCTFPQRTKTFLPPTNERDLCQWDDRFFYSTVYDYCFRYPDGWTNVTNTGPRTVAGSIVTANTFSIQIEGNAMPIFDLYATSYGDQGRQEISDFGVSVAYDNDPYIIGYIVHAQTNEIAKAYAQAVPKMMESIQVFAPPQGRQ